MRCPFIISRDCINSHLKLDHHGLLKIHKICWILIDRIEEMLGTQCFPKSILQFHQCIAELGKAVRYRRLVIQMEVVGWSKRKRLVVLSSGGDRESALTNDLPDPRTPNVVLSTKTPLFGIASDHKRDISKVCVCGAKPHQLIQVAKHFMAIARDVPILPGCDKLIWVPENQSLRKGSLPSSNILLRLV